MRKIILILVFLFFGMFLVNGVYASSWNSSLDSGLVSYWSLNETSGLSSLNNINASLNITYNSTVTQLSGKIGNGLYFNGSADSQTYTNFDNVAGNFSISFWGKLNSTDGTQEWIGLVDSGGFAAFRIFTDDAEQTIRNRPCQSEGTCVDPTIHVEIPLNTFFHYVAVANGTHWAIYVNGTLRDLYPYDGTYYQTQNRLGVGSRFKSTEAIDGWLNGTIDEIGIWNRTLSATDVSNLYNSGNGVGYHEANPPNVTLNYPINNSNFSTSTITFSVTPQDSDNSILNVSIYGNWSGAWHLNASNISALNNTQTNFTISGIPNGKFVWNALVSDGVSSTFATGNFTFNVSVLGNASSENVYINNNLTVANNVSASWGIFNFLGSSVSRIVKGWFTDFDVSGTTNLTGPTYIRNASCSVGQVLTTNSSTGLVFCTNKTEVKSGRITGVTEGSPIVISFTNSFTSIPYCSISVDLSGSGSAIKGYAWFTHSPNTTSIRVDWDDNAGGAGKIEDLLWVCTSADNF